MASCEQWREAISAYADGECGPEEQRAVEAHLRACADCRAWREQVTRDQSTLTRAYLDRQPDLSESVMRRVRAMSQEEKAAPETAAVGGGQLEPAYAGQAPARERTGFRVSWVEWLVLLGIGFVLLAFLFPVFARSRSKARVNSCLSNVKQLALGTLMFAGDHDRLPYASTWSDDIFPYVKNHQIFRCPNDESGAEVSYALVSRWSGAVLKDIPSPGEAIIIYEVQNGQPAHRHNGGMNVGYADGHVKWLKELPAEVTGTTAIMPAPDRDWGLGRKLQLAYDAACEVWVTHLQESVVTAEQAFYQHGGFVLSSTLVTVGEKRQAEVTGKVPMAEVGNTLNALAALGYVARREIQGQDVTDQYTAQMRATEEAERQGTQVAQEQARAPQAKQPSYEPAREAARQKLGQAQDQLFGTQRELALATISATLLERAATTPAAGRGLAAAWGSFVRAAAVVGVALVWVGLYGLLLAPVVVGVAVWRRRRRR